MTTPKQERMQPTAKTSPMQAATTMNTPKWPQPWPRPAEGMIEPMVLDISPSMASYALEHHKKENCRHSESRIKDYLEKLKKDQWALTHQGIAYDTNDKIHDGYHRLHAIARSGMVVKMMVTFGLAPETFDKIDVGFTRTPGHMLRNLGSKHPDEESSACSLLLRYAYALEHGTLPARSLSDKQRIVAYWSNHPDVAEITAKVLNGNWVWTRILPASVGLTLAIAAVRLNHPVKLVAVFLNKVGVGANLGERDPALALRNRLQQERRSAMTLRQEEALVMTIRAYTKWVQKGQMRQLYGTQTAKSAKVGGSSYPEIPAYNAKRDRTVESL